MLNSDVPTYNPVEYKIEGSGKTCGIFRRKNLLALLDWAFSFPVLGT